MWAGFTTCATYYSNSKLSALLQVDKLFAHGPLVLATFAHYDSFTICAVVLGHLLLWILVHFGSLLIRTRYSRPVVREDSSFQSDTVV